MGDAASVQAALTPARDGMAVEAYRWRSSPASLRVRGHAAAGAHGRGAGMFPYSEMEIVLLLESENRPTCSRIACRSSSAWPVERGIAAEFRRVTVAECLEAVERAGARRRPAPTGGFCGGRGVSGSSEPGCRPPWPCTARRPSCACASWRARAMPATGTRLTTRSPM